MQSVPRVLGLLLVASGRLAAQGPDSLPHLAASSFASVEVHVNAWKIGAAGLLKTPL